MRQGRGLPGLSNCLGSALPSLKQAGFVAATCTMMNSQRGVSTDSLLRLWAGNSGTSGPKGLIMAIPESANWKFARYIRPSWRHDPRVRQLQEDLVTLHKRTAARRLRHCLGCKAFLPRASSVVHCQACAKRERHGSSAHWWAGLRGREKRMPRPAG